MSLFIEAEHPRAKTGSFIDKIQSCPEVGDLNSSVLPSAPSGWKDGDAEYRTGALYDGWVTSDEVADRADEILASALEAGEVDPTLAYEVTSENSGNYGLQSATISATIPADREAEFITAERTMTDQAAALHSKLERIVGAWSWSRHEPWAAQEHMYHPEVRLIVAPHAGG